MVTDLLTDLARTPLHMAASFVKNLFRQIRRIPQTIFSPSVKILAFAFDLPCNAAGASLGITRDAPKRFFDFAANLFG